MGKTYGPGIAALLQHHGIDVNEGDPYPEPPQTPPWFDGNALQGKRLTEAELAAEVHAAAADVYRAKIHGRGHDWELNLRRVGVLTRFAGLPHHDEDAQDA